MAVPPPPPHGTKISQIKATKALKTVSSSQSCDGGKEIYQKVCCTFRLCLLNLCLVAVVVLVSCVALPFKIILDLGRFRRKTRRFDVKLATKNDVRRYKCLDNTRGCGAFVERWPLSKKRRVIQASYYRGICNVPAYWAYWLQQKALCRHRRNNSLRRKRVRSVLASREMKREPKNERGEGKVSSFLPHPLPGLLLAPFFARSLTIAPRSLLLNRTETKANDDHFYGSHTWGNTLGARDVSSAVSGFCQVFIVTRAFFQAASPLVHRKFSPHVRKSSGTSGTQVGLERGAWK